MNWTHEFFSYNQFEHIQFKLHMCDPKNYGFFENMALTKVHIYVIKNMNA
jgi:hypothetical protein